MASPAVRLLRRVISSTRKQTAAAGLRPAISAPSFSSFAFCGDESSSSSYEASRSISFSSDKTVTATLFPGDGIGPEIANAVKEVRSSEAGSKCCRVDQVGFVNLLF